MIVERSYDFGKNWRVTIYLCLLICCVCYSLCLFNFPNRDVWLIYCPNELLFFYFLTQILFFRHFSSVFYMYIIFDHSCLPNAFRNSFYSELGFTQLYFCPYFYSIRNDVGVACLFQVYRYFAENCPASFPHVKIFKPDRDRPFEPYCDSTYSASLPVTDGEVSHFSHFARVYTYEMRINPENEISEDTVWTISGYLFAKIWCYI